MSKTCFYMVMGLPGSGKTYWAYNKARTYDVVLDSDEIRAEEYGDAECQDDPTRIFNIMFQRTRAALHAGRDVYYVATNLSSRRRLNLVKSLKKLFPDIHYYCAVMATPIDVCHERNVMRERVVPTHVIDRMLRQFEMPCEGEGWNKILIHYAPNYDIDYYRRSYARLVEEYGEQGNSHHTLTLQEHCYACGDVAFMRGGNSDIVRAAYLHDYGKVWTAIRWEKDGYKEIHYPNHANVSCYMALTMGYNTHVAQLVAYHMIPHTDQKCQNTWRSRMGEELWKEVVELHHYDEAAHQYMKYYSTEVLKHWIPTPKWLTAMESRQPKEVINVRFCRDCPLFEPNYWQDNPSITVGWCRRLSYYETLDNEVPYYVYVNSNSFCNEDDINDDM